MLDVWNDNAAIIVQIESALGSKNAEEICAVPGVDAIMIGTGDLRLDMRLPFGFDGQEPEFIAAVDRIENAARAHGFPLVGFALGQQAMEAKLAKGYTGLMVGADILAIINAHASLLGMAREAAKTVDERRKLEAGAPTAKKVETNGVHVNGKEATTTANGQ